MASKQREIHAHFDCFGGASVGAMLGACLDANPENKGQQQLLDGIQTDIQEGLGELHLKKLRTSQTSSETAISASVMHVLLDETKDDAMPTFQLQQICVMLAAANHVIPEHVLNQVSDVFQQVVQAENKVYGRSRDHQGEFSAICIVEVVATLLALHKLQVTTTSCSPLPLGQGSVWTNDEGLLPIPSPLTLQLLIGMPTCPGPPVESTTDLVTPTAAALLRVLRVTEHGPTKRPCCFTTQSIGVGMDGNSESHRILRVLFGESNATNVNSSVEETGSSLVGEDTVAEINTRAPVASAVVIQESDSLWNMDELTQLETNLDDMTAEALAFAVELLLEKGSLDAWVVPIVMKKGRAAHALCCLCRSTDTDRLLELMFRHTTTLGIRIHEHIQRAALRRSFLSVQMPFSEDFVQVKVGYLGKEVVSVKAEYDDCARISRESRIPIQQVADSATQQAHAQLRETLNADSTISP